LQVEHHVDILVLQTKEKELIIAASPGALQANCETCDGKNMACCFMYL
jgi:hypothetical protein